MRAKSPRFQNLWELTVLCTLREAPMHPYEILRILKERHKEEVLELKRGSLYHAIDRLLAAGHIEELDTTRNGRRPERTTYRITEQGERHLLDGLRSLVAVPRHEASEFMAAMNFVVHLGPRETLTLLDERSRKLEAEIAVTDEQMAHALGIAGRVNLLETEYQQIIRRAELAWIRSLAGDLRSGRLDWNIAELLAYLRVAHERRRSLTEASR
jgi:DNA-binding PadR family transcriptional regulator